MPRFRAANTQVLGISIDSIYSHANWGKDLGGVSFPLLSDFHPKGAVAKAYGMYLENMGITDRSTVVIDASGKVRHASTVGPGGERKPEELLQLCEKVNAEYKGPSTKFPEPQALGKGTKLFVKSQCGFSRSVLLARANLHLDTSIDVVNVTENPQALNQLREMTGKETAPCMVCENKPMHESKEIIAHLVNKVAPLL